MTDNNRIRIRVIEMEGAKDDLTSVLAFITGAPTAPEPMALPETVAAEPEQAPERETQSEPPKPRPKASGRAMWCDECQCDPRNTKHREHKRRNREAVAAQSAEPTPFS